MNAWLIEYAWLWQLAGWTMIHFLWIGAIAAIIGGALRLACRRAAPNVRYAASLATLAALAAAPIPIAAWIAANPVALELAATRRSSAAERVDAPTAETRSATASRLTPPQSPPQELAATRRSSAAERADAPTAETRSATASRLTPPPAPPAPSFVIPHSDFVILHALVSYLPAAWLVGAPLTFLLLAAGLIGSQRLRRQCTPLIEGPVFDASQRLRAALGVTQRVSLAVCDRIAQPVLIGIARPLILLPAAALAGWSPQELEMVLLHELAHVRRWDNLVNLLQRLVESALFFHPAVWLASRQVRRDREECCDAIVVARTERPREYAELLVSIAAALRGRGRPGSLAAASAMADHPLAGRIRRILNLENEPMRVSTRTIVAVLAAPLLLATATLYAVAEGDDETNPPPSKGGARGGIDPATVPTANDEQANPTASDKRQLNRLVVPFPEKLSDGEINAIVHQLRDDGYKATAIRRNGGPVQLEVEELHMAQPRPVYETKANGVVTCRIVDVGNPPSAENVGTPYSPELVNESSVKKITADEEIADLQRQVEHQRNVVATWMQYQESALSDVHGVGFRAVIQSLTSQSAYQDPQVQALQDKLKQAKEKLRAVMDGETKVPDDLSALIRQLREDRDNFNAALENAMRAHRKQFEDNPDLVLETAIKGRAKAVRTLKETEAKLADAKDRFAHLPPQVSVIQWPQSNGGRTTAYLKVRFGSGNRSFTDASERPSRQEMEKQAMAQLALVRSPKVIERALQAPELATLFRVNDRVSWVAKRVKASYPGDGEIMELRIEGTKETAEADRKLLTALINVYVAETNPRTGWSPPQAALASAPPLSAASPSHQKKNKETSSLPLSPGDSVNIQVEGEFPEQQIDNVYRIEAEGTVALGPTYGRVRIAGKTIKEAEAAIQSHLDAILTDSLVQLSRLPTEQTHASPSSNATQVFRYDGKTFDEWRSQWKHELKIERRIEAIEALAAFARAGYAKDAAEAILDVAGEYDFTTFNVTDPSPEGKLRHAIVNELWSPKMPMSVWMSQLMERVAADQAKWKPLASAILGNRMYYPGGQRPLDAEARSLLIAMASDAKYGPNADVLRSLLYLSQDDQKVSQLVKHALRGEDAQNALQMLSLFGFGALEYLPEQIDLLFHKDAEVRRAARTILAGTRSAELTAIADKLLAVLDDPERTQDRIDAVRALGVLLRHRPQGRISGGVKLDDETTERIVQRLTEITRKGPVELLWPAIIAGADYESKDNLLTDAGLTPEERDAQLKDAGAPDKRDAEVKQVTNQPTGQQPGGRGF